MAPKTINSVETIGNKQPAAAPNFLCRPCLVNGTPMLRDMFALVLDIPRARFSENDNPGMPKPFFLAKNIPPYFC
jgi:hypothetical protein